MSITGHGSLLGRCVRSIVEMQAVRYAVLMVLGLGSLLGTVIQPTLAVEEKALPELTANQADVGREIRVFELEHLATKSAQIVLRTILDTRLLAEVSEQRALVLRGDAQTVEVAARILREIDVPLPRWRVDLILVTGNSEEVIRRLDAQHEEFVIRFGEEDAGNVRVEFKVHVPGVTELRMAYEVSTHLAGNNSTEPYSSSESGEATLGSGDRMGYVRPSAQTHRKQLASLFGLDGEVKELFLRVHRME